jgi:uncharacterized protein (TIGR04255 family)
MAKLPNAPLQEVIFEIRWALLPSSEVPLQTDGGFQLASGRLQTIIAKEFPIYRRIIPLHIPDQLLQYQVVHQYWKGDGKWPAIQLGPGIFTVNCTEDAYEWESQFRPLIINALSWLSEAYLYPLAFQYANLKYIDVIKVEEYGGLKNGWKSFIEKYFNIEYRNKFEISGIEKGIQINQTFILPDESDLVLQFSDGLKGNEKAFVWQTSVAKRTAFESLEEILKWADNAHLLTHTIFKDIVTNELYGSFSRTNDSL